MKEVYTYSFAYRGHQKIFWLQQYLYDVIIYAPCVDYFFFLLLPSKLLWLILISNRLEELKEYHCCLCCIFKRKTFPRSMHSPLRDKTTSKVTSSQLIFPHLSRFLRENKYENNHFLLPDRGKKNIYSDDCTLHSLLRNANRARERREIRMALNSQNKLNWHHFCDSLSNIMCIK